MFRKTFIERLVAAGHVVVLSGAGASAESGIPTFRDPEGLWAEFDPTELASMSGFLSDPVRVQSWYSARSRNVLRVEPHAGHHALVDLERLVPKFTLITQNVDGLHARAGNRNVLEIHGSLLKNRCVSCGDESPPLDVSPDAPEPARCECGGLIRPSVVWYGELLDPEVMREATAAAEDCDVFLSVGTGAEVHPAASLPLVAADAGAYVVEVNPRKTMISDRVDEAIRGPAGAVLPALLERLSEVS